MWYMLIFLTYKVSDVSYLHNCFYCNKTEYKLIALILFIIDLSNMITDSYRNTFMYIYLWTRKIGWAIITFFPSGFIKYVNLLIPVRKWPSAITRLPAHFMCGIMCDLITPLMRMANLVLWDFNVHVRDPECFDAEQLVDVFDSANMTQHFKISTHYT